MNPAGSQAHGSQHHIRPLTTLRFAAALYVVLFHTLPAEYRGFGHGLVRFGYSSVSFFFVLSGFVLSIAYADRLATLDRMAFWRARFARIYPLFFLTACLDTPKLLVMRIAKYGLVSALAKTSITFIATLLMLHAWLPRRLEGINFPSWSLSVEALFYLIFPFVAATLWRRSAVSAASLLGLVYGAGLALVWAAMHLHLQAITLQYFPLLHVAGFLEGILLARLYTLWIADPRTVVLLHRLAVPASLWAGALYALLVWNPTLVPVPIVHDGGLLLAFAPMIVVFAAGNPWIEAIFSRPFPVLLGEASYGLYLLHIVLWHYAERFITGPGFAWRYALYLSSVVPLSILSFLLFERPARQWLLRRTQRPATETILVASLAQERPVLPDGRPARAAVTS